MVRIRDALPELFNKAYPVIDPKTEMLAAMSLLRFHEIDALPLSLDAETREHGHKAVFGFSSLARLLLLKPKDFADFLSAPCEVASERLATVRASRPLASLLDVYERTKFGFARVDDDKTVGALASLTDVMVLYESRAVSSALAVREVASPIVSTKGETTLRKVLELMFEKRHRRIFVSGERAFVSDRAIIGHVFSPSTLSAIGRDGSDVLASPVSDVEAIRAKEIEQTVPLGEAAKTLRAERAGQCLVFDGMVVTPWDLVMKPWKSKALRVGARN